MLSPQNGATPPFWLAGYLAGGRLSGKLEGSFSFLRWFLGFER